MAIKMSSMRPATTSVSRVSRAVRRARFKRSLVSLNCLRLVFCSLSHMRACCFLGSPEWPDLTFSRTAFTPSRSNSSVLLLTTIHNSLIALAQLYQKGRPPKRAPLKPRFTCDSVVALPPRTDFRCCPRPTHASIKARPGWDVRARPRRLPPPIQGGKR